MTKLWNIGNRGLTPLKELSLSSENELEGWIENDVSMIDPDLMIIGRQVPTEHGGRIDLLAINDEGGITLIELKRDRTPRDIVAQILDYASWVVELDTPDIHRIADRYWTGLGTTFSSAFVERFGLAPPEPLNTSHRMVIVAGSLDAASQRIVEYLAVVHDVGINTAFFTVFGEDERRYIAADWLMDQEEVTERTERRVRAPWTGYWYVNAGDGVHRSWDDMRKYGFIAAGGGQKYSDPLSKLTIDDPIYVYQAGRGYVGFGRVTAPVAMARDVRIDGTPLLDLPLTNPTLGHDKDEASIAEHVVRVIWQKSVPIAEAKTFTGAFANQNVVCRLTHAPTLEYLAQQFGTIPSP